MNSASHQSKSSLFIGDLAIFCTEEDIRRIFSPYGEISEVKIIKSEETSRNLSYGFITFVTVEAAADALSRLNGQLLCGRPMRINWASYKNKPQGNIANGHSNQVNNNNNNNNNAHNNISSHSNLNNNNNNHNHNNNGAILRDAKGEEIETSAVHVSFISYQTTRLVTEESLRALYSKYGRVLDVSIKKSMIDRDISRQSGYGFVHYELTKEGVVSAVAAAKELTDTTIDDVNYKSSISHNLKKFIHSELEPTATPASTATSSSNINNNMNHVNGIAQTSQNSNPSNYLYNSNSNAVNNNSHPQPNSAVVYSTNNNHSNANNVNSMQIAQMPMTQMYPNAGHPAVMNQVSPQMSMMTAPPMAPPPLPYAPPHHHLVQVSPIPSPVASYVALPPGVFLSAPPPPPPLPPNNNNNNNNAMVTTANNNGTIMSPSPPVYYATTLNNLPPLPPNTTLNHNNNNHNNNNNGYIMQQLSPLPSPVSPSRSLSQDSYREEFNRFMVSSLVSPVSYYTHSPATTVNTSSPLVNLQTAPLFPTVMLSADGSYPMASPQQTLSNNMNNLNMNGNNANNGNGNMSQADLILQQRAGLSVARNIQASRYNNNSNTINNTINNNNNNNSNNVATNNNNMNNNVTSTARARSSLLRQNLAMHSK